MAVEAKEVMLPRPMWASMKPILEADSGNMSQQQRQHQLKSGPVVCIRLRDGKVKRWVEVDWDGRVRTEQYEEHDARAEKFGPPRFAESEVESWGFYKRVWQPSLMHPLRKSWVWQTRVWADGSVGAD
jgi:hypothetical protein